MGCVSSKPVKRELVRVIRHYSGGDHVVSLTSTSYGLLKLENEQEQEEPIEEDVTEDEKSQKSKPREEPEIIDAWELMEDLEEAVPASNPLKISPKSRIFRAKSKMSPFKFVDKIDSPKKNARFGGKENKGGVFNGLNAKEKKGISPKCVLKKRNQSETRRKGRIRLSFPLEAEESNFSSSSQRRKSFSPNFEKELVASYERDLRSEQEQIKTIISPTPKFQNPSKSQESERILEKFEKKCLPGGENAVIMYTTTLRGIRKTFEDCNTVRSIIESHQIRVVERDMSMHLKFKDEIRGLIGTKEVRIPLVFIKGRLVGGVDEIVKLEEEGKLGILLKGIPMKLTGGCEGCGGMRFMMCMQCNGSCKVIDEAEKKMVRCGECNENGLIVCPICS